jgi:hypothetical protein
MNPIVTKADILYVIPFRGKNQYRKKNLRLVIQWITSAKKYLKTNYDMTLDIMIVEQDREPYDQIPKEELSHLFLANQLMFNKGWSFNVAVKQAPNYHYYGFADADIVIPNVAVFCDQLVEHCVIKPKQAFRPFTNRLDTSLANCSLINSFDELLNSFPSIECNLPKHGGLSFASNMIFLSKATYEQIGGWDEIFRGWGRYDDFITHKLSLICQLPVVYSSISAVHLWHPVTLDFSLNPENVDLYNKLTKYNKNDLLKLIDCNRQTIGISEKLT